MSDPARMRQEGCPQDADNVYCRLPGLATGLDRHRDLLDQAGITARPATDEDRERWAAMVRQQQGLEALEAS